LRYVPVGGRSGPTSPARGPSPVPRSAAEGPVEGPLTRYRRRLMATEPTRHRAPIAVVACHEPPDTASPGAITPFHNPAIGGRVHCSSIGTRRRNGLTATLVLHIAGTVQLHIQMCRSWITGRGQHPDVSHTRREGNMPRLAFHFGMSPLSGLLGASPFMPALRLLGDDRIAWTSPRPSSLIVPQRTVRWSGCAPAFEGLDRVPLTGDQPLLRIVRRWRP